MFFSGGPGKDFYAEDNSATEVLATLGEQGLEVVQVRWSFGWLRAAPGEQAGPAALACRPATVVGWVHDNYAEQAEGAAGEAPPGTCGFCLTGNSGGASQIAYALSHYGLAPLVDVLVASSGPPHAQLGKGCLRTQGEEPYWFEASNRQVIDSSYGADREGGPCVSSDASFVPRFDADSIDLGGEDYRYLTTRVHFIVSPGDSVVAVRARDLAEKLRQSGSPWVTVQEVPDMTHNIQQSPEGLAALEAALLGQP
ncbi:hypothetical protein BH20ACT2_BH20ACT2_09930 [soil metagenome]